jgi:hypothetical protein
MPLSERLSLILLAVCSLGFVVTLNLTPVFNNDFWIQLKVGDLIRETGALPETILFPFGAIAHKSFVAYEWLPSLAWSHLFAHVGFEGMVVVKCVLAALVFALAALLSFQVNRSPILSLTLACLCILGINYRTQLRPELLGFVLALLNLNLVYAFVRSGQQRWLWGLLPSSVLWANCHGSFLINLALPGFFALGELVDAAWSRWRHQTPFDRSRLRGLVVPLTVVSLAIVGASLLNPYGFGLLEHVTRLSGSDYLRQNIFEWTPTLHPALRQKPFFAVYTVFVGIVLLSTLVGFRRLKPSLALLLLAALALSLDAVRHTAWLAVFAVYPLAHLLDGALDSSRERTATACFFSVLLLIGSATAAARGNVHGTRPGFRDRTALGPDVVQFIESHGLRGNVFNSYSYGDQLVYHFYPELRVTIDSRVDAYGEEYYRAYRRLSGRNELLLAPPAELLEFLERHEVRTIVVRSHGLSNWVKHGHAGALAARAWQPIYRDARTVILTRSIPPAALPAEAGTIPYPPPSRE